MNILILKLNSIKKWLKDDLSLSLSKNFKTSTCCPTFLYSINMQYMCSIHVNIKLNKTGTCLITSEGLYLYLIIWTFSKNGDSESGETVQWLRVLFALIWIWFPAPKRQLRTSHDSSSRRHPSPSSGPHRHHIHGYIYTHAGEHPYT